MRYESKLPQVNHKTIYALLNKLTNRRPVKITVERDLFRDLNQEFAESLTMPTAAVAANATTSDNNDFERTLVYKPKSNHSHKFQNATIATTNKRVLRHNNNLVEPRGSNEEEKHFKSNKLLTNDVNKNKYLTIKININFIIILKV
jgi:hypothetical protein